MLPQQRRRPQHGAITATVSLCMLLVVLTSVFLATSCSAKDPHSKHNHNKHPSKPNHENTKSKWDTGGGKEGGGGGDTGVQEGGGGRKGEAAAHHEPEDNVISHQRQHAAAGRRRSGSSPDQRRNVLLHEAVRKLLGFESSPKSRPPHRRGRGGGRQLLPDPLRPPPMPKYVLDLYEKYRSGEMNAGGVLGNTVRSIPAEIGEVNGEAMFLFNLSSVAPTEHVLRAHVHLYKRKSTSSPRNNHPHRKKKKTTARRGIGAEASTGGGTGSGSSSSSSGSGSHHHRRMRMRSDTELVLYEVAPHYLSQTGSIIMRSGARGWQWYGATDAVLSCLLVSRTHPHLFALSFRAERANGKARSLALKRFVRHHSLPFLVLYSNETHSVNLEELDIVAERLKQGRGGGGGVNGGGAGVHILKQNGGGGGLWKHSGVGGEGGGDDDEVDDENEADENEDEDEVDVESFEDDEKEAKGYDVFEGFGDDRDKEDEEETAEGVLEVDENESEEEGEEEVGEEEEVSEKEEREVSEGVKAGGEDDMSNRRVPNLFRGFGRKRRRHRRPHQAGRNYKKHHHHHKQYNKNNKSTKDDVSIPIKVTKPSAAQTMPISGKSFQKLVDSFEKSGDSFVKAVDSFEKANSSVIDSTVLASAVAIATERQNAKLKALLAQQQGSSHSSGAVLSDSADRRRRRRSVLTNEIPEDDVGAAFPKYHPPYRFNMPITHPGMLTARRESSPSPSSSSSRRRGGEDPRIIPHPQQRIPAAKKKTNNNGQLPRRRRKHRKRKNHRRRTNRKPSGGGRRRVRLPEVWEDYHENLATPDNNPGQVCSRRRLVVDFADIGWGDWIISPKSFEAHYCSGTCPFPLTKRLHPTNHATIQSIVNAIGLYSDVPAPCCVPDAMTSVTLLYFDENRNVVLKNYPGMSVQSCACR